MENKKEFLKISEEENTRIAKSIGIFFREKREAMNISLRELSRRTGVSISTITELERGNNLPKLQLILYLGLSLGLSTKEVINSMLKEPSSEISTSNKKAENTNPEKLLKAIFYDINAEGIHNILCFIDFIRSNNKYLSKSAYKKIKISAYK